MLWRVPVLMLAGFFLGAVALAEDAPAPEIPHGDFLEAMRAIQDGVGHFGPAPVDPGLYGKHQETWKRYAKPRVRRMQGRIKILLKPTLWGLEEGKAGPATSLDEGSWSALAKGVTALYAELGTMRSRYGEQRVNNRAARKSWLRRYPGPEPIGRVPSRDALDEINRTILEYRLADLVVPYRLISARNRVADIVYKEEAAARAIKQAEYDKRKHEAWAAIDASVAATMGALRADVDQLRAQQMALQRLVAAAQEVEEVRLKALVASTPKTGDHLAKVPALFKSMEAGRRAALGFNDKRSSRWGSLVRQKWMTYRTKILSAVKKAVKADAEAKALKGEESGG